MIHDACVEVTCDGPRCRESLSIELPFTYPDYSGKGGRYDHRPEAVNPLVRQEGWKVRGEDEHFCEACGTDIADAPNEDEDDDTEDD